MLVKSEEIVVTKEEHWVMHCLSKPIHTPPPSPQCNTPGPFIRPDILFENPLDIFNWFITKNKQ